MTATELRDCIDDMVEASAEAIRHAGCRIECNRVYPLTRRAAHEANRLLRLLARAEEAV